MTTCFEADHDLSDLSDEFEESIDMKLSKLRVTEHELIKMVDINEVSYSRDLKHVNNPADMADKSKQAKLKARKNRERKGKNKKGTNKESEGPKLLPGKVQILKRAPITLSVEAPEFVPSSMI